MTDQPLPALFLSHGSPMLIMDSGAVGAFWRDLGAQLGPVKAVLAVSAHWQVPDWRVSVAETPDTIHDFYGFPAPLYDVAYTAPGAPDVARRAAALLQGAGIPCALDDARGLDHGAWVPLREMMPDADVPVAQLSILSGAGPRAHFEVGRALAPLRAEGVLVMASGGAVHNLGALDPGPEPGETPDWAARYDDWLAACVEAGDADPLIETWTHTPDGRMAHPNDDHLLPLMVAFGAGGGRGRVIHRGFSHGSLSLAAYAFD